MSLYQQAQGFIIHQRAFSDTSQIIEFFSQDHGVIHVLAKGIKTNKNWAAQIQPFALLKIQYFGRSSLKKLSQINVLQNHCPQGLVHNTVGLYLNELIHHGLTENDPAEALFDMYQQTLIELGQSTITALLRRFEYQWLKHNGFDINVEHIDDPKAWLGVDAQQGIAITQQHSKRLCKVVDVEDFLHQRPLQRDAQKRFNAFMVAMIDMSLSYRKLYSRELLKSLMSK